MRAFWQASLAFAVATVVVAASVGADQEKTLSASYPASQITRVAIQAGVGDVTIRATQGTSVTVDVSLTPRRGGIFASLVRAEEEVDQASLEATTSGGVLQLTVAPKGEDRRFEENWTVGMPAGLALHLKVGVGDVTVTGVGGGVELDVGVGDTTVDVPGGDLHLKLGVGDADLTAPAAAYGPVNASGGIGDATITVADHHIEGSGMVGRTATWQGQGASSLKVDVGVGDAQVILK